MQRWKEEFVGHSNRKCVQINLNGVFDQGKTLYMEPDWDCVDLLNAASQRMDMVPAAKRVFNADGSEIDDCMMIVDDDILFFSKLEDFISPESMQGSSPNTSGRSESERLPHSLGGYKVGELLGRGGFGEVRLGEHSLTGEKVALKFLRKAEIHSLGAAERTNTEIQCLATLKHMNIIKMVHHLESVNHVVLIFELMEGGDLLHFLLRRGSTSPTNASGKLSTTTTATAPGLFPTGDNYIPQSRCTLSEDEARHTFYQVVSAISYAHNQHICHRDLKLENILLKDNSLSLVKIADFGLSDFYRPGATMKSSCGTLSFLAPEVFKGTSNAGPPLDVWSLGVILFAMLCGRLPFEGPDLIGTKRPREQIIKSRITKCQYKIDDHLGPEAKDLVRRMLRVDPSERASIPEVFNHVWMRAAVGGCLPDLTPTPAGPSPGPGLMQSPGTHSNLIKITQPAIPEMGIGLFPNQTNVHHIHHNTTTPEEDDDMIPPLERADSLPAYQVSSKGGRHRSSLSINGLSQLTQGRSNSSISSNKSQVSSSADLLALEALVAAAEAPLLLSPGSPPLSARRHSNARQMLFSPSKEALISVERGISNSSIDFSSGAECLTPRGGAHSANAGAGAGAGNGINSIGSSSMHSPSPYSVLVDEGGPSTPSQGTNKAFKLVPMRRQVTGGSEGSDFISPSAKLRSNSISEAGAAPSVGVRPITGRRAGAMYSDYDDEDDSLSSQNWRNITLDPSPSSNNLTATTTPAGSSSRKVASATGSTAKARREVLSQSRASSSSNLSAAGGSGGPNSSTPANIPGAKTTHTPPPSMLGGRSGGSNLASAAVASLNMSSSPGHREDFTPSIGSFAKPSSLRDFTSSSTAANTGIATITPIHTDLTHRR